MLLKDKVALITGAASGIGEASARLFAREGASVVLADINEEQGQALAQELGGSGVFVRSDVTDEKSVEAMVAEAVKRFGRIDCAVNNAGVTGDPSGIESTSLESWQKVLDINLTSVFLSLKYELRQMQQQGAGAIVNIASGAGLIAVPNMAPYCATKHAVLGLTKTAASESVKRGIRVNAVLPGSIRTPMLEKTLALGEDVEKMIRGSIPCGRFGKPEEIAESIAWLCSDRASYVSGEAMSVDYATVNR
ncbi:MAG: SDR family NAD(P)-dependent oxidoreductase [Pseudomonadota bacterium]